MPANKLDADVVEKLVAMVSCKPSMFHTDQYELDGVEKNFFFKEINL